MKTIKLEDCCDILDSQRVPITAKNRKKGPYPYYGANGVQDYVADYIFDDNLVLLAEDGGNFGSKSKPIAYRVSGKCWVNNHAHVLKPKQGIDIDYLCYSLMFYDVSGIINGATRAKLTQSAMKNMRIPYTELSNQKVVVNILNAICNVIKKRKKEISLLDNLVKARFVEMFGDPVLNDNGWTQAKLSQLTTKIGSGATPKGGKESYIREGVTLIRSMNVHDGKFEYKNLAHITDIQAKQLENVEIEKYDVLFNITGASIARSCIVPDEILPARVNQHVSIIRCEEKQLDPIFANRMLLTDSYKKALLDLGKSGGATRQAITKQQLENLDVILPPINLQREYSSFVRQVDKSKVAIQKSLDETQLLFDSLMQKYFK